MISLIFLSEPIELEYQREALKNENSIGIQLIVIFNTIGALQLLFRFIKISNEFIFTDLGRSAAYLVLSFIFLLQRHFKKQKRISVKCLLSLFYVITLLSGILQCPSKNFNLDDYNQEIYTTTLFQSIPIPYVANIPAWKPCIFIFKF
jgi:hypothetical protein